MEQPVRIKTDIESRTSINGAVFEMIHQSGDAASCLRLNITFDSMKAQLLPTKGLSVANVSFDGFELFWEAPIGLVDPDTLDLWGDHICINGRPAPGFAFLETLVGGIELYGLRNWGMPATDKEGGLLPVHGETSNIPVFEVSVRKAEETISVESEFFYRTFRGSENLPWHQAGEKLFHVRRSIHFDEKKKSLILRDRITNIARIAMTPDWGYHITLRPEPGSKLFVPGNKQMNRSGGGLPADFRTWHPAENDRIRTETGIIYRDLRRDDSVFGERINSRMQYPCGAVIQTGVPAVPYLQTWFCSGGAFTDEFTRKDGTPLFSKNWDGQGLEIGSSALDHDGNIDPDIPARPALQPGQHLDIVLDFKLTA